MFSISCGYCGSGALFLIDPLHSVYCCSRCQVNQRLVMPNAPQSLPQAPMFFSSSLQATHRQLSPASLSARIESGFALQNNICQYPYCPQLPFPTLVALREHIAAYHAPVGRGPSLICPSCGIITISSEQLQQHLLATHFITMSPNTLASHGFAQHINYEPQNFSFASNHVTATTFAHTCRIADCLKSYQNAQELREHIDKSHAAALNKASAVFCKWCGYIASKPKSLISHRQYHINAGKYSLTCVLCNTHFSNVGDYVVHVENHLLLE